jgi:hypothetical protein
MASFRSPAVRRYFLRIVVLVSIYLVTLIGTVMAFKANAVSGAAAYALAVLPALPIIGVFWAVMRYLIEETDEFMRLLIVRQCLFATGFCLTIMTIWEFLQNFDLVPPGNGGFGAAFFWFIGLGFGGLYNRLTIGTAGCA